MPLYSGLVKILLLHFYLPDHWHSLYSDLIGWPTLRFLATGDVSTSSLAVCASRSDSPLPTTECLQAAPSSSSWDGPVYSAATFPATILSWFKLDLKERMTTNEINCELPCFTSLFFTKFHWVVKWSPRGLEILPPLETGRWIVLESL